MRLTVSEICVIGSQKRLKILRVASGGIQVKRKSPPQSYQDYIPRPPSRSGSRATCWWVLYLTAPFSRIRKPGSLVYSKPKQPVHTVKFVKQAPMQDNGNFSIPCACFMRVNRAWACIAPPPPPPLLTFKLARKCGELFTFTSCWSALFLFATFSVCMRTISR